MKKAKYKNAFLPHPLYKTMPLNLHKNEHLMKEMKWYDPNVFPSIENINQVLLDSGVRRVSLYNNIITYAQESA